MNLRAGSGTQGSALMLALWLSLPSGTRAESVADYAVRISAVTETNPARITLSWLANSQATNCIRYRKTRDATSWGAGTSLATNATNYVDSGVSVGTGYEYRISRTCWNGTTNYSSEGYIYAGISLPLVESRGKIVLLVDNTVTPSLVMELTRLQLDLVGDGWTVLRHDVARNNTVVNIKAIIKADYDADPANVKAVLLLGHVPVPYSGDLAPDGHPNHEGAWPADGYYGDMNGSWTDLSVSNTVASDPRNRNVPGDGKFDASLLPSSIELQVGRVDLANLPAFPRGEIELLRQYLNKDYWWRHKFVTAEPRGLIDDHFGVFAGEAFAVNGWRCFAPFFGAGNTIAADWLSTLNQQTYLWGFGCGSGSYTSAGGVATTAQLVTNDPRVVFTMLFGSYFGDWDSQNNFLRAQLATPTYTLASVWAGRPYWVFHHMGLGETLGFSTRVTQNNASTYVPNYVPTGVHLGLMGDPTLRMHPVAPPSNLRVDNPGDGGIQLQWVASPDAVAGYHVYRAVTAVGPFTRLTGSLLTATTYTDSLVSSNIYMVRAVKLEASASGTYYNPSQGVFQSLDPAITAPVIVLAPPTNNSSFYEFSDVSLVLSLFDPAASISRVEFFADGLKFGESAVPPYSFVWSNAPAGDHTLTARAIFNGGQFTDSNAVMVHLGNVPRPSLGIANVGNGWYEIRGQGTPGLTYRFQFVTNLTSSDWQNLSTVTANSSGLFVFTNMAAQGTRFFRSVYP